MKYLKLKDKIVDGFYSKDVHDIIPEDTIEITDELWQELLELGQAKLINDKTENFVIEDFEVFQYPPTEKEILQQELNELEKWFEWYDTQVLQYERSLRIGVSFDKDINLLDKEAQEKAKRIKELREG